MHAPLAQDSETGGSWDPTTGRFGEILSFIRIGRGAPAADSLGGMIPKQSSPKSTGSQWLEFHGFHGDSRFVGTVYTRGSVQFDPRKVKNRLVVEGYAGSKKSEPWIHIALASPSAVATTG